MASPSLCDDFASTVELFSTFIKQMKAENPQLNVSEVSFAHGKGGKNSFGKQGSAGISNVSNATVYDRFFGKHEYHALNPGQNSTLRFKRLNIGHVGNGHGVNGNGNGKDNGKGPTFKSLTRSIAALANKFDNFNLPDDDYESSEEEQGTSNHSNASLTRQSNNTNRGGN
jgi:hypothetical protein